MNIDSYTQEFIKIWNVSSNEFPQLEEVNLMEKMKREEELIKFSKGLKNDIDFKKMDKASRQKFIQEFQLGFNSFFKNSFGFSDAEIEIVSESGMMTLTKEFMAMARRFDPEVNIEDVFQASRNLWIINSLQIMMDAEVKLSPSVFAYSMLYPYSDNYLDDAAVSGHEKLEFSFRFRQRLKGDTVIPANNREKTIFDLVAMIEEDWCREEFPGVYESLLGIHDAQTKSIDLMVRQKELSSSDLLEICVEKGGTSVLADGYLINGTLTPDQERFCFGFGAFLQFIDDIQDLQEDSDGELETLFTAAIKTGELSAKVNQTIAFGDYVMGDLSCFPLHDLSHMNSLMIKSNTFLLTEAVGLNPQYYTEKYVNRFEWFSPFRFEFVRKRRSNLESNRISLMKKMGAFIFDESELSAMQA